MGHHHSGQHHKHNVSGRNLGISIVLNSAITIVQFIGGIISGSLSLLSDALHNFSDVLSLLISFVANILSRRKASVTKTFGYKRAEIIAAFVNSATLMAVSVFLIVEAIKRFLEPQEIASEVVILLAFVGILINGSSVLLLRRDARVNMNMKSAYLHLLTDMMASVAVLLGGILMKYFLIFWIDPLLTLLIAIYLIYVGYNLLKESTKMLMLFTPKSVTVSEIVTTVMQIDQVKNMHHVHIWQLNEDELHLEAHIDFEKDIRLSEFDQILNKIEEKMKKDYGINHVNIQPEFGKRDSKNIIVQD
ncbi:MAG: cation diffusion facilitator family transporter [Bacteroidota bacterium]